MKVVEFFAKYEDDEQMMSQVLAASKDENTLREFLSSHGVEVVPADRKKEMSDEELSEVSGGNAFQMAQCVRECVNRFGQRAEDMCIKKCEVFIYCG